MARAYSCMHSELHGMKVTAGRRHAKVYLVDISHKFPSPLPAAVLSFRRGWGGVFRQ
jgi:hypothetical protein